MIAGVITVDCGFCHGKPVERPQECTQNGEWVDHDMANSRMTPEMIDGLIREWPGVMRWVEAPCPRCGGRGEYEVEATPCRIF